MNDSINTIHLPQDRTYRIYMFSIIINHVASSPFPVIFMPSRSHLWPFYSVSLFVNESPSVLAPRLHNLIKFKSPLLLQKLARVYSLALYCYNLYKIYYLPQPLLFNDFPFESRLRKWKFSLDFLSAMNLIMLKYNESRSQENPFYKITKSQKHFISTSFFSASNPPPHQRIRKAYEHFQAINKLHQFIKINECHGNCGRATIIP